MLPLLLLGMQIDASVCKVILVIYICMLISIIKLIVYVPTDIRDGAGNVILDDSDSDDDYPIHFQGRGKWHLKLLEKDEKGSCHHRKTTKSYSGNRFCCIKWYYEMILWAILQFYNMSLMSCARYTTWNSSLTSRHNGEKDRNKTVSGRLSIVGTVSLFAHDLLYLFELVEIFHRRTIPCRT